MKTKTPSAATLGGGNQNFLIPGIHYQIAPPAATGIPVTAHAVAEGLLGEIDWRGPDVGYCHCPGAHLHTRPNGKRDCRVTLDAVPTVHCLHSSCAGEIERVNHELRSAIGKAAWKPDTAPGRYCQPTAKEQRQRRERQVYQRLKLRAKQSLTQILADFATDPVGLFEESPIRLLDDPRGDWRLLVRLFKPDDVVWIGDIRDSGTGHERNFRSVADWLTEESVPAPLVCPNTFAPGSTSRSNDSVLHHRFLVVESDTLPKEEIAAVFSWCRQFLRLRAVVDTAGRSLHGWFDYPVTAALKELRVILPELGCDAALFKPSQPCRLPGARRGDKRQALLYLDLEGGQ